MKLITAGEGKKREWMRWLLLLVFLPVVLSSCAPQGFAPDSVAGMPWNRPEAATGDFPAAASEGRRNGIDGALASPPRERPGIATGWGREVKSEMTHASFRRASSKPYSGVTMINYNDRQGIEAMTGWTSRASTMQEAAGGLVEWGVKGSGGSLKSYRSGSRRFVEGKEGQRYVLVVKNKAKSRLEVVLSVDGLDVMDGKTGSTHKRGYIIEPGRTLEVKGWRKSYNAVASFRFSGVGDSYAGLKHGDTRNVGVIGLAVFTEKGVDPFTWMPNEVKRRGSASPFAEAPVRGAQ